MRPTRVACRLVAALKQESSHDLLQAGWGVNSSKGSTSWIRSFGSVHRTAHEQQQITTVSGHRNATANEWPTLRDVVKQQHMRSNKVECNLESDFLFLIAVSANYFVALSRIIYRKQDINKRVYIIYIYMVCIACVTLPEGKALGRAQVVCGSPLGLPPAHFGPGLGRGRPSRMGRS